ncbi:MAG: hypothetical protein ACYS6W_17525 [Planctomycetota bacterium]|jgi:hypothetical protein
MPELIEALALLAQGLILTAANCVLVLYLTDTAITGPINIFERIRFLAGIEKSVIYNLETDEDEVAYEIGDRFWAKVLDCHRCTSPYAAFLIVVLAWITGLIDPAWTVIVLWMAVTGATILVFELINN